MAGTRRLLIPDPGARRTRAIFVLLLALLIGLGLMLLQRHAPSNAARANLSVEQQIAGVPLNSLVQVCLHSGVKVVGWLRDVSGTGFILEMVQTRPEEASLTRQIAFSDVRWVKYPASAGSSMGDDFKGVAMLAILAGVAALLFITARGARWW